MSSGVVDLHDLAAILLRERQLTFREMQKARLIDISYPPASDTSSPSDGQEEQVVSYLLDEEGEGLDADAITEPSTFIHPDFSDSSPRPSLSETERIFWCCKHYNDAKFVTHAMQIVLDKLPQGAEIRIRTSQGHSIVCSPRSFFINMYKAVPRTIIIVCRRHLRGGKKIVIPYSIGSNLNSLNEGDAWVNMFFYTPKKRFVLDLATPALGFRGLGGELFALEEANDFGTRILFPSISFDPDDTESINRLTSCKTEVVNDATRLADKVIARLNRIQQGQEKFCAYCGKVGSSKRCSKCRVVSYCDSNCQKSGWKYHKTWCEEDAK